MRDQLRLLSVAALLVFMGCADKSTYQSVEPIGNISIHTDSTNNRAFSFTNKRSAYYYGFTNEGNHLAYHCGFNIAGNRIFSDYQLQVNGKLLNRKKTSTIITPNELIRTYKNGTERLMMIDNEDILVISFLADQELHTNITLDEELVDFESYEGENLFFTPKEDSSKIVLVSSINKSAIANKLGVANERAKYAEFIIITASSKDSAIEKKQEYLDHRDEWIRKRSNRINRIVESYEQNSNNDTLNQGLKWIGATMDQLVTNQQGKGIYAGLPWFTQYWGRDQFIAMPGAVLVNGDFEVAKEILTNFAKFQYLDIDSNIFGRIPNRAQPTNIIYNTTDGTPRYVIQIMDYVKYSGDTSIIRTLFPSIKNSVEGSIKYWVDEYGFLTHEDADTWMDAKKKGTTPYSPRGNRANDIQSLWLQQLQASIAFAQYLGEEELAIEWNKIAEKLQANFVDKFTDKKHTYLADRIEKNGEKDFQMRPNQLYAFEFLSDTLEKGRIARKVWESLVYPWGMASLSQLDPDFFPYHEHWHYYHKDASYHNGTVWLWNNGIAMQRLIELGQADIAYRLFENMNHLALTRGAVGSLPENSDALLLPGAKHSRLTGAFLQAWSNAEQLRVWYQYFLGVRPDLFNDEITIAPRIPLTLSTLSTKIQVAKGFIDYSFQRQGDSAHYSFTFHAIKGKTKFEFEGFSPLYLDVKNNTKVTISVKSNNHLHWEVKNKNKIENGQISCNKHLVEMQNKLDQIFEGCDFAVPYLQPDLKALSTYHQTPITY